MKNISVNADEVPDKKELKTLIMNVKIISAENKKKQINIQRIRQDMKLKAINFQNLLRQKM